MENGKLFTLSFLWTHLWARSYSLFKKRKIRAFVPKEYESKGEKRMKRKNKKKRNKCDFFRNLVNICFHFSFLFLFFS